jgi:1-hydroxycarotenoid 3,4-desaturase
MARGCKRILSCSTAIPRRFHDGLLAPAQPTAVPKQAVAPRSLSAFVWGFAAEPKGVELAHHNVFFCDDPEVEFGDIAKGGCPATRRFMSARRTGGGGPTHRSRALRDHHERPPGAMWPRTRNETDMPDTHFRDLGEDGAEFSPVPDDTHLTTPADFDRAFPASDGSLYGRSPHGMMATFHRPGARTKVPGLYLCGGGTHPGAGIPMACLSGKHAAAAI